MEKLLFDYEEVDEIALGVIQFYKVTTVVEIEDIPKGTKYAVAVLNLDEGHLTLQDEVGSERRFKLSFKVLHEIAV